MLHAHKILRLVSVTSFTLLLTTACKFPSQGHAGLSETSADPNVVVNDPDFCTKEGDVSISDYDMPDIAAVSAYNNAYKLAPSTSISTTVATTVAAVVKPQTISNEIVIGQDVLDEVSNAVLQEITKQVRAKGDLSRVDLTNLAPKRNDLKIHMDIKQITDGISETLDLSKVDINFRVRYNYSQVYNKAVSLVSYLVANYPLNGRAHRCIGRRIGNHKGIVYRRFVGPMIAGAIAEVERTADVAIRKNLRISNLNKHIAVDINRSNQRAAQTTLTMSSTSSSFPARTVTYSQAKAAAQQVAAELKKLEAAIAAKK